MAPALALPDVSNPFHLFVQETNYITKMVLTQTLGPQKCPVGILWLDPVAIGWPTCLRAVTVKEANKLTLILTALYGVEAFFGWTPNHWLSNACVTQYQALLLNHPRTVWETHRHQPCYPHASVQLESTHPWLSWGDHGGPVDLPPELTDNSKIPMQYSKQIGATPLNTEPGTRVTRCRHFKINSGSLEEHLSSRRPLYYNNFCWIKCHYASMIVFQLDYMSFFSISFSK